MKLDEIDLPPLIDHIGWRLTRLSRRWITAFEASMAERGHAWMTQAQGSIVGQLRNSGVPQAELAGQMGITKQAVQQHVDALVAIGVVERIASPQDARARIVRLTEKGAMALADSNAVKIALEAEYRAVLGDAGFAALEAALDRLFEAPPRQD